MCEQARGFAYDNVSNLSSETRRDGNRVYTHDALNRLQALDINGARHTYAYNAVGQRVCQSGNGINIHYIHGAGLR